MNIDDPKLGSSVQTILKVLDRDNKLLPLAKETGIAGGVDSLREIANQQLPLAIIDAGSIGLHLGLVR